MRTIKGQNLVRNEDLVKYPFGGIKNETDTQIGTPVVEEIYNDIIQNIYAVLKNAGITPNENPDNESTSYQFLEALKLTPNSLNDIQQTISIANGVATIGLDLAKLPSNYFTMVKLSEDVNTTSTLQLSNGAFSSSLAVKNEIKAGALAILIVNSAGSSVTGVSDVLDVKKDLTTPLGTPLAFNESDKLTYYSNGYILTDIPTAFNIETLIKNAQNNTGISVLQVGLFKEKLICFCWDATNNIYKMFSFNSDNLTVLSNEISIPIDAIPVMPTTPTPNPGGGPIVVPVPTTPFVDTDYNPYIYFGKDFIYFTNSNTKVNGSANTYDLGKFSLNSAGNALTFVSSIVTSNLLDKTTNAIINSNEANLITLVNGSLVSYNITGSANRDIIGVFPTTNGNIFNFNKKIYYGVNSVAYEWSI